MHTWKRLIWLAAMLLLPLLFIVPTPAFAADAFAGNHLSDYGIPDNVTEVLMANSRYADGQTPIQREGTPDQFTIGDVEQLVTVSLADVTYNPDGTIASSQPDSTVAAWIAGAQATEQMDISQDIYGQNTDAKVTDQSTGTLVTKKITGYSGAEAPAVNFLFQIVATAKVATSVDLTGVTSQVTDSASAQRIMALFQTNRLAHLTSLILADDNLGDLNVILNTLQTYQTLFGASADQRITTLDLSDNGIPSFPWSRDLPIGVHLTELNLTGNHLTAISDALNQMLTTLIVSNNGIGHLEDLTLSVGDTNSVKWLVTLMNAASGSLKLSDGTVNVIMQAVPNLVDDAAIDQYLNQLNVSTATIIFEATQSPEDWNKNKLLTPDHVAILKNYIANGGHSGIPQPSSLTVSQSLGFGTIPLSASLAAQPSTTLFTVAAVLQPNASISVELSDWSGTTSTFTGSLTFGPNATQAAPFTVTSGGPAEKIYTNKGTTIQTDFKEDFPPGNVTLGIPAAQQAQIHPGTYSATLKWTIANAQSATQQ